MRKWKKLPKGNVKAKLIVAYSTVHPDTTAMTANAIEAHGGKFVACPVFGAPAMTESGQLTCCPCGAKKERLEK